MGCTIARRRVTNGMYYCKNESYEWDVLLQEVQEGELPMGCTIARSARRRVTNGMYFWKERYEWDVLLQEVQEGESLPMECRPTIGRKESHVTS